MQEGVAMHDNLQAIEDLMKVNSGNAAKGDVFESYKSRYAEHFAQNEAIEQQKQNIAMQIQQQAPAMMQLLNTVNSNPAKNQFFEKINEAIIMQEHLSGMLEQGTQFYMKINDILIRLQQSINDYKFSRDLEKNDLLQQIQQQSGGAQQPPATQPSAGLPPAGQPPAGGQPQGQQPPQGYGGYGQPAGAVGGWQMPPAQAPGGYGGYGGQ